MTQAIPGYLQAQQYPPPQFPPQQFAPPQFAPGFPPAAPAQPQQPLAQGSIDDFYAQPSSGGGKSLSFEAPGQTYTGVVTRPISSGDIQQQTDIQGKPQFFRDGRPKFVMRVPLQTQPSPAYPDGLAQWYVKGQARDELVRAMAEAGAPAGPPEAGAVVQITFTGTRPSGPGMNPAKLFAVTYRRPDGQSLSAAPVAHQAAQPGPVQAAQPVPQQPAQAVPAPPAAPAPVQAQPPAVAPAEPPAAQTPAAPSDLSPEQQALLAKLTGAGS